MRKFEAKKQLKSRIYSRTTLIVLLFVIILTAKGVFNIYLRNRESVAAREDTAHKLRDLQGRKQVLDSQITKLKADDGVDREIREKFNVIKPGENVVIIVPPEIATTTDIKQGFFEKLWQWLW